MKRYLKGMRFSASAPGKVILCGEYAVLDGKPAIVMAVNRRVFVQLTVAGRPASHSEGICLTTPGFHGESILARWSSEGELYVDSAEHLHLFLRIFNQLFSYYTSLQPDAAKAFTVQSWQLDIDSRALFDGDKKLGLGSSAALTVALDSLLSTVLTTAPISSDKEVLALRWQRLHRVHSVAQGKRGSGVDIAASLHGGVVAFCLTGYKTETGSYDRCNLSAFTLPRGTHVAYIWTGASASTPAYLHSLSAWRKQNVARYEGVLTAFEISLKVLLDTGEANDLVNELKRFTAVLHTLSESSGLEIFANGHEVLYRQSHAMPSLMYKPCGAGGGDLGIAISHNADDLRAFISAIVERGFHTVDLAIDDDGAKSH